MAVREAADESGQSLSQWLSQAAEARLNADRGDLGYEDPEWAGSGWY